ncbi:helix-turn-helix domain-containing protein [Jatrophihabitans lederbergiae]|uniref:Helix-turn-helix transcriptional regulator n=1 Tax=Jatrophihabitans lederbergiae TaxID=3075547 RepID=A0ABU2JHK4_9ACTN|nr:helix-turn-helix transcriptional regulator [Jatrophihabitans sp. DSM 44399]MDT0264462.1 helix-turn-helix transcriptional regulator [Jatrophihabitans sp. DSM 44399]
MRLRNRLVLAAFVDNARMSEREIARRAGLSHSTANHLITGRRTTCSLSTAVAIAQALHCPNGTLFNVEEAAEQQAVEQIADYEPSARSALERLGGFGEDHNL